MVSQEAQFMAGAFLVVVAAAAAADVCRWYAAPYSITLVSVKVASDFGVVFGQVCICRLCQNPTKCGQKCCCVKPTRLLSAYLLWTFPFNKLVALAWPTKSTAARERDIVITKTVFYYYFRDLSYLQEVP